MAVAQYRMICLVLLNMVTIIEQVKRRNVKFFIS